MQIKEGREDINLMRLNYIILYLGVTKIGPTRQPEPFLTCETRPVEKMGLSWVCPFRPVKKRIGFEFDPTNPITRFSFNI